MRKFLLILFLIFVAIILFLLNIFLKMDE